jgi:hypothetical protein
MIVVQSGESRINDWIVEEPNAYEDYKKVFGYEPPMIDAVGIMTDTDDTKVFALSLKNPDAWVTLRPHNYFPP